MVGWAQIQSCLWVEPCTRGRQRKVTGPRGCEGYCPALYTTTLPCLLPDRLSAAANVGPGNTHPRCKQLQTKRWTFPLTFIIISMGSTFMIILCVSEQYRDYHTYLRERMHRENRSTFQMFYSTLSEWKWDVYVCVCVVGAYTHQPLCWSAVTEKPAASAPLPAALCSSSKKGPECTKPKVGLILPAVTCRWFKS